MSQSVSGTDAESKKPLQVNGAGFAALASSIVEDCLVNIIHETVIEVHRNEKLLRMQSAATIADKLAFAQAGVDITTTAAGANKNAPPPPPPIRVETPGAVYDNGTVCLTGNPLKTTPEVVCPSCKLPRLPFPFAGVGSRKPDLTRQYCTRHPYVSQPGHDCHGVPFPSADGGKPKKDTKAQKQDKKKTDKGETPTSQDGGNSENPPGSNLHVLQQLGSGSKGQNYVPWTGCPNCRRSMLIVRFAQHLDRCIGLSTRSSGRTAAGTAAAGTTASNTPLGSRRNTPAPNGPSINGTGSALGGKDSSIKKGDDKEDETPKKKKKNTYVKKADRERMAQAAAAAAEKAGSGIGGGGSVKRERDADETGDSPRKKSKGDDGS